MIAVDTSAILAILLDDEEADACVGALEAENRLLISAGTVAETLIVAGRRNVEDEAERLLSGLGFEIIAITPAAARRIASVYSRWGKGLHPAGLNFGDCFAYEVAREHDCRLLFTGQDFARTDIVSVLRDRGRSLQALPR